MHLADQWTKPPPVIPPVNEAFSDLIGSAAQISAWATQHAAIPAYLLASLLAPGDQTEFLHAYVW
jgi:hypothetical protein